MKKTKKKTGRNYGRKASAKVANAMRERKRGTLRSGRWVKKVTSHKQASDRARSGPSGGGKGPAKGIAVA